MNWIDRVRSRRLDRLAARRMIAHVAGPLGEDKWGSYREKGRDDLVIEAWLWRRYGNDGLADTLERAVRTYDKTGVWPWPTKR